MVSICHVDLDSEVSLYRGKVPPKSAILLKTKIQLVRFCLVTRKFQLWHRMLRVTLQSLESQGLSLLHLAQVIG